ncbi:hypothetical protein QTG54_013939 [Skeletonema marinoi]|uniref:Uncharacterized protein n=1 Tax=Skeletonema marinoi TaxID=267567 RepID=A0AAD8XXN4_9STRA|nr:hypothetical protein QTG54_013939 [Skeletonema marinoi]
MASTLSSHSLLWAIFALLSISPNVASQGLQPYDCIDPQNPGLTSRVEIGQNTTVCLYTGPDGDWNSNIQYKRFSVNLVADEFANYKVPGSYSAIVGGNFFNGNATQIFAASQSALSFQRRYYDATTNFIFPYLTIIVDVVDGVVRGIAWDDACVFCEKKQCLPNTYNFDGTEATSEQASQPTNGCYLTKAICEGFQATGSDACDLKLYVVWTGTDVNGNVLKSSDSRFSAFPPNRIQEQVVGSYDSMMSEVQNFGQDVKDKLNSVGNFFKGE